MITLIESHLGIITLFLAIGTFWMALSTRAAAIASRQIFALEARPYLVFSKPMFRVLREVDDKNDGKKPTNRALKLGIEFRNSGRVPLRYSMVSMHMTFDNRTVDNPMFKTKGGIIYPGDFGVFWFGTLPYQEEITTSKQGVIDYKIKYEAIDQNRDFLKTEKMSYTVNLFDKFNVDWHYLEDSMETAL